MRRGKIGWVEVLLMRKWNSGVVEELPIGKRKNDRVEGLPMIREKSGWVEALLMRRWNIERVVVMPMRRVKLGSDPETMTGNQGGLGCVKGGGPWWFGGCKSKRELRRKRG